MSDIRSFRLTALGFGYLLAVASRTGTRQLTFYDHRCRTGRGGPRKRAGRKPLQRPIVHHIRRARFSGLTAGMITLRVVGGIPSLRQRLFVSEIQEDGEGRSLTGAILAMAQSLGLPVVAEGVETAKQANFLRSHGCEELQGYLLGRAVALHSHCKYKCLFTPSDSHFCFVVPNSCIRNA